MSKGNNVFCLKRLYPEHIALICRYQYISTSAVLAKSVEYSFLSLFIRRYWWTIKHKHTAYYLGVVVQTSVQTSFAHDMPNRNRHKMANKTCIPDYVEPVTY